MKLVSEIRPTNVGEVMSPDELGKIKGGLSTVETIDSENEDFDLKVLCPVSYTECKIYCPACPDPGTKLVVDAC